MGWLRWARRPGHGTRERDPSCSGIAIRRHIDVWRWTRLKRSPMPEAPWAQAEKQHDARALIGGWRRLAQHLLHGRGRPDHRASRRGQGVGHAAGRGAVAAGAPRSATAAISAVGASSRVAPRESHGGAGWTRGRWLGGQSSSTEPSRLFGKWQVAILRRRRNAR